MSLPTKNENHLAEARALIIDQFKGRPRIDGVLRSWVGRVQELETAIFDVIDARILDTATNAQLESLGSLVGEKRLGRSDADFRQAIRLRIRVNRSKGRTVDVLDVATLAAAPERVTYEEYAQLQFSVEIYNRPGERYVAELLSKTRPATSNGILISSDLALSSLLAFDDAVSPIAGIETFSDAVSSTGKLAASGYGLPTDFSRVTLAGGLDLTTLAWSAWARAAFSGAPWVGTPSAGGSGSRSWVASGSGPSVGSTLNGLAGALFSGGQALQSSGYSIGDLVGAAPSGWTFFAVFSPSSLLAAGSPVFDRQQLLTETGGWMGVGLDADGLVAWSANGGSGNAIVSTTPAPVSVGTAQILVARWTGTHLQARVGKVGSMTTGQVPCSAMYSPFATISGNTAYVGQTYAAANKLQGTMWENGVIPVVLSDVDVDAVCAALGTRFGI